MRLLEAISALKAFKASNPKSDKASIESFFQSLTQLTKTRSVFVGTEYVFRFSEANTGSFSNVVLSLSALLKYDTLPVIICIVRPDRLDFRLCNTTFLKRISHSSHKLGTTNIKGSFLGHDILDEYEGIPNRPERFDELIASHAEFSSAENVQRLVEATNSIVARSTRYEATSQGVAMILQAPERADASIRAPEFAATEQYLASIIGEKQEELVRAASIDNVNLRGNLIEQIITGTINAHRLDDLVFHLPRNGRLIVDIKTKLLDRASAPKAYNLDKMLTLLSNPGTVFAFFFIGLNPSKGIARSRLISIFDPVIINATRVQTHWAGRASRGVTQLGGDLARIFDASYTPSVDIASGIELLRSFIER